MRLLIKQVKIIDPSSPHHHSISDILIEHGVIQKIAANIDASDVTIIEGKELHISNGWIDMFADYCEPGYEHKETITSGVKAAAAGGFTHVCLVPNTKPTIDYKGQVQHLHSVPHNSPTQIHALGAITQKVEGKALAEMMDMYHAGAVAFSDGWQPVQNENILLKALDYVKSIDSLVIQMPDEQSISDGGQMHEGIVSTQIGMPGIAEIAETIAVQKSIQLLNYTQSKLHLSGISTGTSVALIRAAKAEGLPITCSVTPYHLLLTDEALRSYDSMYKVFPPLRTEADRQALIEGLKDGTIDAIASHHRPQDWDAKQKEFDYASFGMNVQQYVFPLIYQALKNELSIDNIIALLSTQVQKILQWPTISLMEGNKIDATVFTLKENTELNTNTAYSKSDNHPFNGQSMEGKIIATLRAQQYNINH